MYQLKKYLSVLFFVSFLFSVNNIYGTLLIEFHDPIVFLQSDSVVNMTKNELLAWGKIDVYIDDFAFDYEYKVISYRVSAIIAGYNYEILNKGATFSPTIIDFIGKLKTRQKVYFEDIKVAAPDGRVIILKPLTIRLI